MSLYRYIILCLTTNFIWNYLKLYKGQLQSLVKLWGLRWNILLFSSTEDMSQTNERCDIIKENDEEEVEWMVEKTPSWQHCWMTCWTADKPQPRLTNNTVRALRGESRRPPSPFLPPLYKEIAQIFLSLTMFSSIPSRNDMKVTHVILNY